MGDDDTLWLDPRTLRRMLSKYNDEEMHFIASTSERRKSLDYFGRMSYGGGGLIMSAKLVQEYIAVYPACLSRWPNLFGGDEAVNNCVALARGIEDRQQAYTEELGMHQMDILGVTSGFLQSGVPMLNMHHFFSWARLMPDWVYSRDDYKLLAILMRAAKFLGGDNMFTRYSLDDGKTVLVNGYSITRYLEPLTAEDLKRTEVTWGYGEDLDLTFLNTRRPIREIGEKSTEWDLPGRQRKSTYYLTDVRVLDDAGGQAMLVYRNRKGKEIELFWNEQHHR